MARAIVPAPQDKSFFGGIEMHMDITTQVLIIWLVVGAIAGWLAGTLVKGGGFGLVGDIVVGIIGAFIGGWLLPRLGISFGVGIVPVIITATIGAVVLLLILRLIRRL
jgi:uncharacterized membrane protein YeaQ/YmgE (transglycosylase-associated protein family)